MFPRRTHLVLVLLTALAAPVAASAETTFTFTGHGYGHGVGMGQYGAQGYAQHGWTHQQILAHYYQGTTLGPSVVAQVRVLLQEKLTSAAASAPGGLTASDEGGSATLAVPGAGVVTVRKDASGFSLVDATGSVLASGWTGPVALSATGGAPLTLAGAGINGVRDGRYRGTMRVLGTPDGLQVVNIVSLENYLRGVVASEMPSTWEPQALETQAIAARTYAVATRKPASSAFDLYPDERSQVYRGLAAEGASSSAAIDATAGQVVLYQGQPIVAYFSSSSGGRTAAAQESLNGVAPAPYLVPVDDPYDTISPYHDWTLSLSDRDLSQQAAYPGLVTGLQVDAYSSGRVNTVTLNGSAGPLVLSASLVRKRLGLRSTWFTATPGAPPPKLASTIALHSRVVRSRVLLTGTAPPGAASLQAAASRGWRILATHQVADDGAVSFRRPVGEAARYRLISGSLASAPVPVIRRSGVVLRGRPGALMHGRLFPKGALGFVALQHVVGGRWTWVARAKTRADGSFTFGVRAGGGRWRVRWRGAGSFLGALSPELRVGRRTLAWTPTDPLAPREWNLTAVNAFGYADTLPVPVPQDAPVTVAVIDSGIDRTSPDLAGAVPLAPIDEAHDPSASLVHGTAVAGIIAADANNGIGGVGVGVPYVKLLDYRVVSGGDVDPQIEARAIRDAVGAGARVINLSLGGTRDPKDPSLDEFSRAERDAISYAFHNGTVVVAAVGNSPDNAGVYATWPAALRHVLGVSAVTQDLAWAPFSNTDPVFNDLAAPGVGIITTVPRSLAPTGSSLDAPPGFTIQADGTVMGTSFSAPAVSAAAAVLLARHADFTPTQVMWILEHSARRLGDTSGVGRDRLTGFGVLDVTAAVKLADGPPANLPPADADEPNDVAKEAQILPLSNGSIDAVADFGDDRRDVYKVRVRAGETLRVRTDPLPQLSGNLGLDVAVFAPDTTNLAGPATRSLVQVRPTGSASGTLRIRNSTPTDGFYLVQVSARRGWGAYRLRWTISAL
ncbi:MAG TPA: SpoIID/LytB domain-containing protein [Gaiellales bacterium]|nr:SpoIID/LytB domain-containing protein [Gaiellales bacterium]